jgi:hypothetical protein
MRLSSTEAVRRRWRKLPGTDEVVRGGGGGWAMVCTVTMGGGGGSDCGVHGAQCC